MSNFCSITYNFYIYCYRTTIDPHPWESKLFCILYY
nr:MAG TPA: hypothetical protein [Bacteriophage sp.]